VGEQKQTHKKALGTAPAGQAETLDAMGGWTAGQQKQTHKKALGQAPIATFDVAHAFEGGQTYGVQRDTRRVQMISEAPKRVEMEVMSSDVRHEGQRGRAKRNVDIAEDPFPQLLASSTLGEFGANVFATAKQTPTFKNALGAFSLMNLGGGIMGETGQNTLVNAKATTKVPTRMQSSRLGNVGEENMMDKDTAGLAARNTQGKAKKNHDVQESALPFNPVEVEVEATVIRDKGNVGRKTKKEDMVSKVYLPGPSAGDMEWGGQNTDQDTLGNNRHKGKMLKKSGLKDAWENMIAKNQVFVGTGGGERMEVNEAQYSHRAKSRGSRGDGRQGAYEERRRLSATFSQGDNPSAMAPRGVPEQIVKPVTPLSERQRYPDEVQQAYAMFNRFANRQTIYSEDGIGN
jgi:hypothetical protein